MSENSDESKGKLLKAVYTPQQVSTYGLLAVENIVKNEQRGVHINIPELGKYVAPIMPGQICAVIAQTHHYKSGFLHFLEHELALQLVREQREDEIIVHVSVEEGVEEQAFLEFARYYGEDAGKIASGQIQDWDKLREVAVQVSGIPIYRIGDSLARTDEIPSLHMSNMIKAINHLINDLLDWKPRIAALFFDYLQAFPIDPDIRKSGIEGQRRLQVREDIYKLRRAASHFSCPVFVAVQAKQHLDGCKPPIMVPGIYDGEESSSIAQRCDRIFTLWMPAKTHAVGEQISFKGREFSVGEDMLWIKVAKQRGGFPSGAVFPCLIDFKTNKITIDDSTRRLIFGGMNQ
jgi:hypothetical protein